MATEQTIYWAIDVRVQVNRIDDNGISKPFERCKQPTTDILKTVAEGFPAVAGHEHHAFTFDEARNFGIDTQWGSILESFTHPEQGIHNCVSGDFDGFLRHARATKVS